MPKSIKYHEEAFKNLNHHQTNSFYIFTWKCFEKYYLKYIYMVDYTEFNVDEEAKTEQNRKWKWNRNWNKDLGKFERKAVCMYHGKYGHFQPIMK